MGIDYGGSGGRHGSLEFVIAQWTLVRLSEVVAGSLSPLSSLLGVYELERRHTLIHRTFLSHTSFCLYVLLHLELTRSRHLLRIRIQSTSINILNLHGAFGKQQGGDRQPRKSTFR